ncbi:MAG: hypothetical protein V1847_02965 [Candidatus Diapherotrites archaeon]
MPKWFFEIFPMDEKGQPAMESMVAIVLLLLVSTLVLAMAFQRSDASNQLNELLTERNTCQTLASSIQEMYTSPHNMQLTVELRADANIDGNAIFLQNDFCYFLGVAQKANLKAGTVILDKNKGGVFFAQ